MPFEVRVLGPVELVVDGSTVSLPPLERTLLAILAANLGRIVATERLIHGLWEGPAPGGARNRVQAVIASLRRLAGPELIGTKAPGYQLGERVGVDATSFAEDVRLAGAHLMAADFQAALDVLDAALRRWRDDAFVDVGTPLVAFERDALHEMREHAREERIEALLSQGRHRELIPELVKGVNDQPLRSRLRGQLMVALQRCGREAEALAVYRDGARLLAEEHGLDPGQDLRRLQGEILAEEAVGTRPLSVRPNQLPGAIPDFVGRDKELGHLRTLLSDGPDAAGVARVIVVSGLAGTGKTTLAVRAAHEHRRQFPGGCLFADLRGTTPDPARPGTVLGAFLRSLGVAGRAIPSDVDERAALYRSVLADQRVLIMLDGAADEAQVRPLLPPGPSCALITTTASLSGIAGIIHLPLDVLPVNDGLDLLSNLAGVERVNWEADAAVQVVELCGGLPLALRIAGVRLAHVEIMPMTRLRDRLVDSRRTLDELSVGELDVRSSFAVGFTRLRPDAARLLGMLGRTGMRTFGHWDDQDEPALEELCRAHMLTVDGDGRIRMHDLVRLYARERTEPDYPALLLWYQRFVERAESAARSVPCRAMPPLTEAPRVLTAAEAVRWFEDERENVAAAVADLLALGEVDLAGRAAYAMAGFALMRSGHQPEWEQHAESILKRHEEVAGLRRQTHMSLLLALATFWRLGDRRADALVTLRKVRRGVRGILPDHEHMALLSVSTGNRMLGNRRVADAALRAAFDRCADARPVRVVHGYTMLILGQSYAYLEDHMRLAQAALAEAVEVFQRFGDRWGAAVTHESLGILHNGNGEWARAELHIGQSIEGYRDIGDRLSMTISQQALASVHVSAGNGEAALALLRRTIPAFREMRFGWGEATSRRLLGRLYLESGDAPRAFAELELSISLLRTMEQPFALAKSLALLARAHFERSDVDGAVTHAREALAIFDRFGSTDAVALRKQLATWQ